MTLASIFNQDFFEMCFLLCFAAAWPANIVKSLRARTARGKSVVFEILVMIGYGFGIVAKLVAPTLSYVIIFYIINLCMVGIDVILYVRNSHLDHLADLAQGLS